MPKPTNKAVPIDSLSKKSRLQEAFTGAVRKATEVLGSREEALRWLGHPVAALGYETPVSILGTEQGRTRVDAVLTQVEHGVW